MPPLVTVPGVCSSPPWTSAVAATRSFSTAGLLGKAVGSNPFVPIIVVDAAATRSRISGRPDSKW